MLKININTFSKIFLLLVFIGLTGCDTGGDTSTGSGTSAGRGEIEGNVASSDLSGDVSGIDVSAQGISTQTDANGNFQLTNVPPGTQTIVFGKGGQTASLSVSVPANGRIKLLNVQLDGGTAQTNSASSSSSRTSSASAPSEDNDSNDDDDSDDDD